MVFGPVQAGTGGGSAPVFGPVKPKSNAQKRCEGRGGIWNEETKECSVAEETAATDKPVPSVEQPPERAEVGSGSRPLVIEDAETGEPIGIRRNGVTTFLPRKEIENIVRKDLAKFSPIEGSRTVAQAEKAQSVAAELARLEEEAPIRPNLAPIVDPGLGGDPEAIGGELFPIIGPLGTFMKRAVSKAPWLNKIIGTNLVTGKELETMEDFTKGLNEQQLMEIGLYGIENAPSREITKSETVGAFVEALGLGSLSNFAAEKPAENVRTIIKRLRVLKTLSTDAELKVRRGSWSQSKGNTETDLIDQELNQALYDLKLLIQNSPEYKFNSDGVNYIEDKIYEAQRRNFDAKIAIAEGKTSDPTEIQVIMDLQQAIKTETIEF